LYLSCSKAETLMQQFSLTKQQLFDKGFHCIELHHIAMASVVHVWKVENKHFVYHHVENKLSRKMETATYIVKIRERERKRERNGERSKEFFLFVNSSFHQAFYSPLSIQKIKEKRKKVWKKIKVVLASFSLSPTYFLLFLYLILHFFSQTKKN